MILKIFLCAAAAVLAVIFIYSYFHFDPKTALIVLMCDVAASYISYKIFSSR